MQGDNLAGRSPAAMLIQEYMLALVVTWVQYVLSGDILASNYSKVSHSGTAYSSSLVKIDPSHGGEPYDTNISVVIGVMPEVKPSKGSFVVYAESVTDDLANKSSNMKLPLSEARMSSGNTNFKSALDHLAQDMQYYRGPVYTAEERTESSDDSAHPPADILGTYKNSSNIISVQSGAPPPLLPPNYSRNVQGNLHKTPENLHPKEATQGKGFNRNDFDKQPYFLKLPQDSYNGPDSYHTTAPASAKSPFLPPMGIYQSEPPKENYKTIFSYQTEKSKGSAVQPMEPYQVPTSTEFYKPSMLNYHPPGTNEPYKGHMDIYQLQPLKQIYEPQMVTYQYGKLKESMKPPEHTQQPPKSKYSFTQPSNVYQPPDLEDSFTPPTEFLQPPIAQDSLTRPVDMYKQIKPEDPSTQYMDTDKPLKPPVDMQEHPKLKDSFMPHVGTYKPPKQYDFKGAMDLYRPYPTKEIHKPLVLSPEEFYKPPMEAQKPSKEEHKMSYSSEHVKDSSQSSPPSHVNSHDMQNFSYNANLEDDLYLDYDPSSHAEKENTHYHEHNNSHESDHLAGHLHASDNDHAHKYVSHDYSNFYLQPPPPPKHSNGAPPPPPKELSDVPPQPPKDMHAASHPPKDVKEDVRHPKEELLKVPPPPTKENNEGSSSSPMEPYGSTFYLPKEAYGAIPYPQKYVYGVHAFEHPYGIPPPPPMATPPPPPPKRKLYGYYQIGRKLYLIPAVFSFLFLPYILALIIKSIIRHKVKAPFKYWDTARKNDMDANDTVRRVARALEAAEQRYK